VTEEAKALLRKYGQVKALRTLDALHLGTCSVVRGNDPVIFVCSDGRLFEIAASVGYEVLDPEILPESQSK
jgi:hypothetical protein